MHHLLGRNGRGGDNDAVKAKTNVFPQWHHRYSNGAGSVIERAHSLWLLQVHVACFASFQDRSTHPKLFSFYPYCGLSFFIGFF